MHQATELCCGHAGLPMDPSWLVVLADPGGLAHNSDFVSRMRGAMP